MNDLIKQKFEVLGQYFDTQEEAEAYLADNKDQARVDAFIQHMRDNGAKRIPTNVPEAILNFIKFENGTLTASEDTQDTDDSTTEPEAEVEDTVVSSPSPSIFDSHSEEEEEKVEEESTPIPPPAEETGRKSLFGA